MVRFIRGYNRFYKISTSGKVWSCRVKGSHIKDKRGPWKRLKTTPNNYGYPTVTLVDSTRKAKQLLVHRLILETFIGPCPEGMEGRHLDNNPSNCNISNICWSTKEDNESDKVANGTANRGGRHGMAKLTDREVKKILLLSQLPKYQGRFGLGKLAKRFGVTYMYLYYIIRQGGWKHLRRKGETASATDLTFHSIGRSDILLP